MRLGKYIDWVFLLAPKYYLKLCWEIRVSYNYINTLRVIVVIVVQQVSTMRTSATIHQHKRPTNDSGRVWKGRNLDAGGTEVGRSADAKQTQRDAVRTHRRSAKKQEGRMRDASVTH